MDEASDAQIATGKRDEIRCPSCDAVLMKVEAAPGEKIRCLNCGNRFTPVLADAGGSATQSEPTPISRREPQSPGYWLLRIPGIIVLTGSLALTIFYSILIFEELSRRSPSFEFFLSVSYLPLLPFYGFFAYYLTRSMAQIDARAMALMWRSGIVREPLPPAPGSALPYIAPLAVMGGVMPFLILGLSGGPSMEVLVGGLFGSVLFYFSFAMEDLRQFAWRQRCMADRLGDLSPVQADKAMSGHGVIWSIAPVAFSFAFLTIYIDQRRRDTYVLLLFCLAFFALSIPLFKLGHDWKVAVDHWRDTVGRVQGMIDWRAARELSPLVKRAAIAPVIWAAYGIAWLLIVWLSGEGHIHSLSEFLIWFFVAVGFGALGLAMASFVMQLHRWCTVQKSACQTLRAAVPEAAEAKRDWRLTIIWVAMVLACIEAFLMGVQFFNQTMRWFQWQEFAAMPIVLMMAHYPTVWAALVLRELLDLENALAPDQSSD